MMRTSSQGAYIPDRETDIKPIMCTNWDVYSENMKHGFTGA